MTEVSKIVQTNENYSITVVPSPVERQILLSLHSWEGNKYSHKKIVQESQKLVEASKNDFQCTITIKKIGDAQPPDYYEEISKHLFLKNTKGDFSKVKRIDVNLLYNILRMSVIFDTKTDKDTDIRIDTDSLYVIFTGFGFNDIRFGFKYPMNGYFNHVSMEVKKIYIESSAWKLVAKK